MNIAKSFILNSDFPKIFSHTTVTCLKNCEGFWEAKNGDLNYAKRVVEQSVKQSCIDELKARFPDAVLLPVRSSDNLLPSVFARRIGLPENTDVYCLNERKRKQLCGMERLLHLPTFFGKIEMGGKYILVDDIVCQGGTIASLAKFVCDNGGSVCAVTALAHSAGNGCIAPNLNCLKKLVERFDFYRLQDLLHSCGLADGVWGMTYQQLMYLLRFKSYTALSEKVIENMSLGDEGQDALLLQMLQP